MRTIFIHARIECLLTAYKCRIFVKDTLVISFLFVQEDMDLVGIFLNYFFVFTDTIIVDTEANPNDDVLYYISDGQYMLLIETYYQSIDVKKYYFAILL